MTQDMLTRIQALMESSIKDAEKYHTNGSAIKAVEALQVLTAATDAYLKMTQVAAVVFIVNNQK